MLSLRIDQVVAVICESIWPKRSDWTVGTTWSLT